MMRLTPVLTWNARTLHVYLEHSVSYTNKRLNFHDYKISSGSTYLATWRKIQFWACCIMNAHSGSMWEIFRFVIAKCKRKIWIINRIRITLAMHKLECWQGQFTGIPIQYFWNSTMSNIMSSQVKWSKYVFIWSYDIYQRKRENL